MGNQISCSCLPLRGTVSVPEKPATIDADTSLVPEEPGIPAPEEPYALHLSVDTECFAVMVSGEKKREFLPLESEWFMSLVRDKETGFIPRKDISHVVFYHRSHEGPGCARFAVVYRGLNKKDNYDITYSNGYRVQSPPGQLKWVLSLGDIMWRKNCAQFGYPADDSPGSSPGSKNFESSGEDGASNGASGAAAQDRYRSRSTGSGDPSPRDRSRSRRRRSAIVGLPSTAQEEAQELRALQRRELGKLPKHMLDALADDLLDSGSISGFLGDSRASFLTGADVKAKFQKRVDAWARGRVGTVDFLRRELQKERVLFHRRVEELADLAVAKVLDCVEKLEDVDGLHGDFASLIDTPTCSVAMPELWKALAGKRAAALGLSLEELKAETGKESTVAKEFSTEFQFVEDDDDEDEDEFATEPSDAVQPACGPWPRMTEDWIFTTARKGGEGIGLPREEVQLLLDHAFTEEDTWPTSHELSDWEKEEDGPTFPAPLDRLDRIVKWRNCLYCQNVANELERRGFEVAFWKRSGGIAKVGMCFEPAECECEIGIGLTGEGDAAPVVRERLQFYMGGEEKDGGEKMEE